MSDEMSKLDRRATMAIRIVAIALLLGGLGILLWISPSLVLLLVVVGALMAGVVMAACLLHDNVEKEN